MSAGVTTSEAPVADALVVFGITGDLARKMTLKSLYLLERRGMLDCPVIGVARERWSDDDLREHALAAVRASKVPFSKKVFDRFAARLSYVAGDFSRVTTYRKLKTEAAHGHDSRCSTSRSRRSCSPAWSSTCTMPASPSMPGWWSKSRSATTSPRRAPSTTTCASCSPRISSIASTTSWERCRSKTSCTCGSPTRCSSRSGTGSSSPRCRSRWPRASASMTAAASTSRWERCATSSKTT